MLDSDYRIALFKKKGFKRRICTKCGIFFWTFGDLTTWGETPCEEYRFIGSPPTAKPLSRYPIVARWRDDVFLTQASIHPFQPWVVSG